MNSSVSRNFVKNARDVEERIASGKLFPIEVAAVEDDLSPVVGNTTGPGNDTLTQSVVTSFPLLHTVVI